MIVLGHRGVRGEGGPVENTLEAFQRALDDGADGVELDVRLARTGEPIVIHDPTLARVTGGRDTRAVADVALADLPRLEGGLAIPTLEEALAACRGKIVNVELKADPSHAEDLGVFTRWTRSSGRGALAGAVARVARRASGVEIVFSSFDPIVVALIGTLAPKIDRAILIGASTPRLATSMPLAMRRIVRAAHLEDRLATPERIERLVRAGLRVAVWTVNDPARARALDAAGASWLITDRPRALVTPRT